VAFSPDGRRIISGCDNTVKIWDVANDQETLTLKGDTTRVSSVAFSPDGGRFVSGGFDNTARVWNAATGQEMLALKGHSGWIRSVAFSSAGRRIVSGGDDGTVKVWDANTGEKTLTLRGHTMYVSSVAFSPDGRRIVSASGDNTVRVWNATTGQETLTFRGHTTFVSSVAFSPDGRRIVSGGGDRMVKVWDAATGTETLTLKGHTEGIGTVAFSPDGRRIVSGSDNTVKVWDAATGQETLTLTTNGRIASVAFSPDGGRIVSGSGDGTLNVWEAASDQETLMLKPNRGIPSVAFSPDGARIVSGDFHSVNVWDTATGKQTLTLIGHTFVVYSVAFSPDGGRIVSGSGDGTAKVWDATTGKETLTLKGHANRVFCVAFSPDGQRIVSGSDNAVKVWDAAIGQETLMLKGHTHPVKSVAFSPDGRRIVSGSQDGTVKVWDATTGQETPALKGHTMWVSSVAFSPDGQRIVSGGGDDLVRVWNAATGQETLTLKGHTEWISSVAFSSDGHRIVSGDGGGTVKVWDAATGHETFTLKGHTQPINSVAFSRDGRQIVSGSMSGTVKVWDAASGQENRDAQGVPGTVSVNRAMVISPRYFDAWDVQYFDWGPELQSELTGPLAENASGGMDRTVAVLKDRVRGMTMPDAPGSPGVTIGYVVAYLTHKANRGLQPEDMELALLTVQTLTTADHRDLAAEMAASFAKLAASAQGKEVAYAHELLEGARRRLALPGNPIRLEGSALDGTKFAWPAYRGKVVLVAFWDLASEPCRLELRHAKRLRQLYQNRGLEVVGISMNRDRKALTEFLQKERVPWVTLRDEGSEGQLPIAKYYGVFETPTMLVVDKQGKVVSFQVGDDELDRLLDRLLGPACLPTGRLTSIDLQPDSNVRLTESFDGTNEVPNNLAKLPQGEQVLAGVKFTIGKRLIQLDEMHVPDNLKKGKAEAISVGKTFTRLYILHGAQWAYTIIDGVPTASAVDGALIGQYRLHYEGGTEAYIPIVLGEDVRDWWNRDRSKTVTRGIVAWVGQNDATRQNNVGLRLYLAAWDNPHPEKKVVSIDFLRDGPSKAGPFCVAMTVEEPAGANEPVQNSRDHL